MKKYILFFLFSFFLLSKICYGYLYFPNKKYGINIVIDPGHGGKDTGAIGLGGVEEKNITLSICLYLYKLLMKSNIKTYMTRYTDTECLGYQGSARSELQCRANIANDHNSVFFLSIHINASYYEWQHGVSCWWYKKNDIPMSWTLESYLGKYSGFQERGVVWAPFYVLRHSFMPASLCEIGFISNYREEKKLESRKFRHKISRILYKAILNYLYKRFNFDYLF
jgi:N-acetylmuramoyl-L-alanine amidase